MKTGSGHTRVKADSKSAGEPCEGASLVQELSSEPPFPEQGPPRPVRVERKSEGCQRIPVRMSTLRELGPENWARSCEWLVPKAGGWKMAEPGLEGESSLLLVFS